jgi:hypothetical protein
MARAAARSLFPGDVARGRVFTESKSATAVGEYFVLVVHGGSIAV